MTKDYFENFKLFVGAIYILGQKSILEQMIHGASRMLHKFVSRYLHLYGLRHISHLSTHLHSLLHLPDVVRDLRPLWVYSCFSFEDIHGKLKNLVRGSRSALLLYNGASLYFGTFTLNKDHLHEGSRSFNFCKNLSSSPKQLKLQNIGKSLFIADGLSKLTISNHVLPQFEHL